mmetsp:Transcript_115022/g.228994  ORF Transcript_115022/g.228994 Transcript_115022/m.228994 type:complete len:315 (-) Transcript_115022:193-1137(-)
MSPYFGVLFFVFRARKSAFSAPKICTVLDGCLARFINEPACAMSRAPTSSPTMYVRLGATAVMRSLRYSDNDVRYSMSSMTRSLKEWMFAKSSSVISVPIEVSAAVLTSAAISSGTPIVDKSESLALVLKPISLTTLAYAKLSVTILPISGKCQPYHSRSRIAKLFNSLSKSSKRPTACIIITSTLSGENFNLKRDSVWARPKEQDLSSCSLRPSIRSSMCILIPRMSSLTLSFKTLISIPSFLFTLVPNALSSTASWSVNPLSTMFFFRNFLRLLPTTPSVNSVAASMAAFVSANSEKACRLTWRLASLSVLN